MDTVDSACQCIRQAFHRQEGKRPESSGLGDAVCHDDLA
jgi:hypothetical protein